MNESDLPSLRWRLGVAMAEKEIRTARELRRRLKEVGYEISEPQLSRLRKQLPRQIDTRLLSALCRVLSVQPGQLIVIHGERTVDDMPRGNNATPNQDQPEVREKPSIQEPCEKATKSFSASGPRVRAIPLPKP